MPAVLLAKECVNRAFETSLAEGIRFERRMFHAAFATEGQKEGMAAFIEKRPADVSRTVRRVSWQPKIQIPPIIKFGAACCRRCRPSPPGSGAAAR